MGERETLTLRQREYREYLRSPHWQEKRHLALEAAAYRCAVCNADFGLDVHHRTYERIGNERLADLLVLCRTCHGLFHEHGRLADSNGRTVPPAAAKPKTARPRLKEMPWNERMRVVEAALLVQDGQATTKQIAECSGLTPNKAGGTLVKLRAAGRVSKSGNRWKLKDAIVQPAGQQSVRKPTVAEMFASRQIRRSFGAADVRFRLT